MNEQKNPKADPKPQPKKLYARPEVAKHGNVETLTQFKWSGPSGPIRAD